MRSVGALALLALDQLAHLPDCGVGVRVRVEALLVGLADPAKLAHERYIAEQPEPDGAVVTPVLFPRGIDPEQIGGLLLMRLFRHLFHSGPEKTRYHPKLRVNALIIR
mgnify:CR=1 FL=1